MKAFIFITFLTLCISREVYAQKDSTLLKKNKAYSGAIAHSKQYHVIYQLDTNNPSIIEKAIRNINNVLEDPRLAEKLTVQLVAFSGGTEAYLKTGKYESAIRKLVDRGVIVTQCLNSLKERSLTKESLYDFIAYVPSGNGELIIRAAEGWTIIKP